MNEKERTCEPIRIMELELEERKKKWLRKYGWKYTCDYIDGYWRWNKKISDKVMICDMGEAINIEYNCLPSKP
ncbi:MAG TPA: hypothetical protein VMW25_00340 [Clostridia bacterium]|nr:hypothetical protein [Clostridia bacterium]